MAKYRLTKGTHSALVGDKRVEYHAGVKGQDVMELTDAQAKLPHLRKRVEKVHESAALDFKPDDDESPAPVLHVLANNSDQVLAYIEEHSDDEEILIELRTAEQGGKRRKGVLDALNDLLGE